MRQRGMHEKKGFFIDKLVHFGYRGDTFFSKGNDIGD